MAADGKIECSIALEHEAQKWLKGHVVVIVHEPIEGSAIAVHFIGKERTSVSTLLSNASDEHLLFDETLSMDKLLQGDRESAMIKSGVYQLPFTFYLKASMPPSIHFDEAKGGSAHVEYQLVAHVTKYDMTVTRNVTVVGASRHEKGKQQLVQEPMAIPLKSFGILDQGRLLLAAKICNTHVGKGERVKCVLALRNESKLEIERVDLQLTETIDWRASSHVKQHTVMIVSEPDINIPDTSTKPTTQPQHGDEITSDTREDVMSQLAQQSQKAHGLKIPQRALETYTGTLLTVKHALKVLVYLKGRMQHPITAMTADVVVFDPPLEDSVLLKNHHRTRSDTTEEIACTKWPGDVDGHSGKEKSQNVLVIDESARRQND